MIDEAEYENTVIRRANALLVSLTDDKTFLINTAKFLKALHVELVKVGFEDSQATEIVSHYSIKMR